MGEGGERRGAVDGGHSAVGSHILEWARKSQRKTASPQESTLRPSAVTSS